MNFDKQKENSNLVAKICFDIISSMEFLLGYPKIKRDEMKNES